MVFRPHTGQEMKPDSVFTGIGLPLAALARKDGVEPSPIWLNPAHRLLCYFRISEIKGVLLFSGPGG